MSAQNGATTLFGYQVVILILTGAGTSGPDSGTPAGLSCTKRPHHPQLSPCLSRACLGKMIAFYIDTNKLLKEGVSCSHPDSASVWHPIPPLPPPTRYGVTPSGWTFFKREVPSVLERPRNGSSPARTRAHKLFGFCVNEKTVWGGGFATEVSDETR